MEKIEIVRTRKGTPAYWVGGGAATNTFQGRIVLLGKPVMKEEVGFYTHLPEPIFVRTSGPLSCANDQVLVPLNVGDVIVEISGRRPADLANPDLSWIARRVVAIYGDEAETEMVQDFDPSEVPNEVLTGLDIYHNRDGRHFCFVSSQWK